MLREDVPAWEIDPELLKMPTQKEENEVNQKSYQLEMDRLNEIITNK